MRCGLTSAEFRGTITTLMLLPTLLPIQFKMLLGFLATWAHSGSHSPPVDQHPQVLFCWASYQMLQLKPVVLNEVTVIQMQESPFCLVEPHHVVLGTSIKGCSDPSADPS